MEKVSFRGKDYPVDINMRVVDAYLRGVSADSIAALERGFPSDLLLLLYLALVEGASQAGVDLDLTADDLMTLHMAEYNAVMEEFLPVVKAQLSPGLPNEQSGAKKKVAKT